MKFLSFLKSKLFVGIASMVVALLVAFVGVPMVNQKTNEKVPSVRFSTELAAGVPITEKDVETFMVTPSDLPTGAFSEISQVVGKYTLSAMYKEDYATEQKLSDTLPDPSVYFYALPKGQMAVSFSVKNLAMSVSGKIMQNNIVSLLSTVSSGSDNETADDAVAERNPGLSYLKVLAVTSDMGADTGYSAKDADGNPILPATITVMANEKQAALIAGLEQNGVIHVALVSRGNAEYAEELLAVQQDYFMQLESAESSSEEESASSESEAEPPVPEPVVTQPVKPQPAPQPITPPKQQPVQSSQPQESSSAVEDGGTEDGE